MPAKRIIRYDALLKFGQNSHLEQITLGWNHPSV
jgi:hypothetical protein